MSEPASGSLLWIGFLPSLIVASFALGCVSGLLLPIAAASTVIGLLGIGIGIAVLRGPNLALSPSLFLMAGGWALVLLAGALGSIDHNLPSRLWWRGIEWTSIGCIALAIASLPGSAPSRFLRLAAGAGFAVLLAVFTSATAGDLSFRATQLFGFPNVNVGVNAMGPILAGGVALWWRRRQQTDPIIAGLIMAGMAAVIAIAIVTGRRGISLSLIVTALVLAFCALWRRHPVATIWLGLLSLAGLTAAGFFWSTTAGLSGGGQRIWIYRSGLDAIAAGGWWGGGFMPSIWLMDIDGPAARLVTMAGTWGTHLHSEPLEVLASAGAPGAIGLLAVIAGAIWSWRRIVDPDLKNAALILILASGTIAVIDPSYSTLIGGGILASGIGIALAGTSRNISPSRFLRSSLGSISILAGSLVVMGLLPSLLAHRTSSSDTRMRLALLTGDPELAVALGSPAIAERQGSESLVYVSALAHRTGWIGFLPFQASDAAFRNGDPQAIVEAEVRILARDPLFLRSHERLQCALANRPMLQERVSPSLLRLIAWIHPDLTRIPIAPILGLKDGLDQQINALIDLLIRFRSNCWNQDDDRAAFILSQTLGDIPSASAILVQIGLRVPDGAVWLAQNRASLQRGLAGNLQVPLWLDQLPGTDHAIIFAGIEALWPQQTFVARQLIHAPDDELTAAIRRFIRGREMRPAGSGVSP